MILTLKQFMEKYNLKDQNMNQSLVYKKYIIIKYIPEILKYYTNKGFINIDDGSQWEVLTGLCFYIKDNKSLLF